MSSAQLDSQRLTPSSFITPTEVPTRRKSRAPQTKSPQVEFLPVEVQQALEVIHKCLNKTQDEKESARIRQGVRQYIEQLPNGLVYPSQTHVYTANRDTSEDDLFSHRDLRLDISQSRNTSPTPKRVRDQYEDNEISSTASDSAASTSTQPVTKKTKIGRPGKKSVLERGLTEITLAIDRDYNREQVRAMRATFVNDCTAQMKLETRQEKEHLMDFTNLIFDEVMGLKGLKRLMTIVKVYSKPNSDEVDLGVPARLASIKDEETTPDVIRSFFDTFATQQRTIGLEHPGVQHLQQIIAARALRRKYDTLRERLNEQDPELVAFFRRNKLTPGVGQKWTTVALNYLAELAGIRRQALINACERVKGVDDLAAHFGEGILPLLPPGSMNRLRTLGNARLDMCRILKTNIECFQPIMGLIASKIYMPIAEGRDTLPVSTLGLKSIEDQTFFGAVAAAINWKPDPQRVLNHEDEKRETQSLDK